MPSLSIKAMSTALTLFFLLATICDAKLFWRPAATSSSSLPGLATGDKSLAPWSVRHSFGAATSNNRLFIMGGKTATADVNDVWSYTPTSGWTQHVDLNPLFSPRHAFTLTSHAASNSLYLIGGSDSTSVAQSDIWKFDSTSLIFSLLTSASSFSARFQHTTNILPNDVVMIIGGRTSTSSKAMNDVWTCAIDSLGTNSAWTKSTGLFPPRYGHATSFYNGSLYLIGGADDALSEKNVWKDVWKYDITATTWNSLLPGAFTSRSSFSLLSFSSTLYLFGGSIIDGAYSSSDEVWKYQEGAAWSQDASGEDTWKRRSNMVVVENPFLLPESTAPRTSILLMGGLAQPSSASSSSAAAVPHNDIYLLRTIMPPSAPSSVVASAVQSSNISLPSDSILVTWQYPRPEDEGGESVENWLVTNQFDSSIIGTLRANETASHSSTSEGGEVKLSLLISSLSYDTNYTFFVSAINIAGASALSSPSNIQTTARAGWKVNNAGQIVGSAAAPDEASDSRVTTRAWFIGLMVSLSVAIFIICCIFIIYRHIKHANKELKILDEIEAWEEKGEEDDDDDVTEGEEEMSGMSGDDKGKVEFDGSSIKPSTANNAPLTTLTPEALTSIGVTIKRDKTAELEKWKRGELKAKEMTLTITKSSKKSGKKGGTAKNQIDTASLNAALDTNTANAPASSGGLIPPLTILVAQQDEQEVIEKLCGEFRKCVERKMTEEKEKNESKEENEMGNASTTATLPPPSSSILTLTINTFSTTLTSLLSTEYQQRVSRDPSCARMLPAEEIRSVLQHAVRATGVMTVLYGDDHECLVKRKREQLLQLLYSQLANVVSLDTLDLLASSKSKSMLLRSKSSKKQKLDTSIGDPSSSSTTEEVEQYLFLLTRGIIISWIYGYVKDVKEGMEKEERRRRRKVKQMEKEMKRQQHQQNGSNPLSSNTSRLLNNNDSSLDISPLNSGLTSPAPESSGSVYYIGGPIDHHAHRENAYHGGASSGMTTGMTSGVTSGMTSEDVSGLSSYEPSRTYQDEPLQTYQINHQPHQHQHHHHQQHNSHLHFPRSFESEGGFDIDEEDEEV